MIIEKSKLTSVASDRDEKDLMDVWCEMEKKTFLR